MQPGSGEHSGRWRHCWRWSSWLGCCSPGKARHRTTPAQSAGPTSRHGGRLGSPYRSRRCSSLASRGKRCRRDSALPCKGDPGCYAWLSGEVLSRWTATVTDQPARLCAPGVAQMWHVDLLITSPLLRALTTRRPPTLSSDRLASSHADRKSHPVAVRRRVGRHRFGRGLPQSLDDRFARTKPCATTVPKAFSA